LLLDEANAAAAARRALRRLLVLRARAAALRADAVALDARGARAAVLELLERHLDFDGGVGAAAPPALLAAAEKHVKRRHRPAAPAALLVRLEALDAFEVLDLALLRVREDLGT
jgi:hypothetical protein